jgi:hypothetical protein
MELYIYNGATSEHIQREYTPEEKAIRDTEIAQAQAELVAKEAEEAAKAQAKAAAEGKLAALGLTTDDLKALGL